MKSSEKIVKWLRTICLDFPTEFLIRIASVVLFVAESVLLLGPCPLIEMVFMRRDSLPHRMADWLEMASIRLESMSPFDR